MSGIKRPRKNFGNTPPSVEPKNFFNKPECTFDPDSERINELNAIQ